jgi:cation transport ATPase
MGGIAGATPEILAASIGATAVRPATEGLGLAATAMALSSVSVVLNALWLRR